jgi:peptide/nickel transport system substrate-binding protein
VQTVQVAQTVEVPVTQEVVKEVPVTVTVAPPATSGTLRVALTDEPNSLYQPKTADMMADIAASQLYDSLVWQDDNGKIVPDLAESWDVSPDGTAYTFHLRHGVVFHNGQPFTADDVIATWQWGQKKDSSAWPDRFSVAKTVEKIDDYTVKVTTDGPKPELLNDMQRFWSIIPAQYMAQVGVSGFEQHPIGTGPFEFVEWVKGDHITYKANPNYWRPGQPGVSTLIFRPIPESATRVAALQTNEIDIVTRLSSDEAQSLLGDTDVRLIQYPVDRIYYIAFNNMTTGVGQPTMDPKVRQAMNYAVDVDGIIKALFSGYGKRAAGFVTTGELGYGTVKPFTYDPAKAKQLLADAGYPNGFTMDMACPAGAYPSFEEVCDAVQGYLGKVGITANLKIEESAQYWDLEAKKQLPPLFGDSWADETNEAYDRLYGALGGTDAEYSSWSDPQILSQLKALSSEVNADKRTVMYQKLQAYMHDNPPFIYLYEPMTFEAVRANVQNYLPRSSEMVYYNSTWLAQK